VHLQKKHALLEVWLYLQCAHSELATARAPYKHVQVTGRLCKNSSRWSASGFVELHIVSRICPNLWSRRRLSKGGPGEDRRRRSWDCSHRDANYDYSDQLYANCPASCKRCSSASPSPAPSCKDSSSWSDFWGYRCSDYKGYDCNGYANGVKDNCPKSCGSC
jgi:hypothetical protein